MQKTESAVRVTHLPTGLRATIESERSQSHNRRLALELLAARVAEARAADRRAGLDRARREMVGSGHIAERRRTYAWREGRVVDHVLGLTLPLDDVLEGRFDAFLAARLTKGAAAPK
jgi:peptide chain release factor 1